MIAAAFDEAEARDPGHLRTWVVLVDGAEHQLDLVRAEAARRGIEIHIVIDLIHVLEYIWKAAWSLHDAGDPAAEDWVAARALAVLAGDSDQAAAAITAEANAAGLTGSPRAGTDTCVHYLNAKRGYLRYDQALEAGWPTLGASVTPPEFEGGVGLRAPAPRFCRQCPDQALWRGKAGRMANRTTAQRAAAADHDRALAAACSKSASGERKTRSAAAMTRGLRVMRA